jgi:hypothetical protein
MCTRLYQAAMKGALHMTTVINPPVSPAKRLIIQMRFYYYYNNQSGGRILHDFCPVGATTKERELCSAQTENIKPDKTPPELF